MRLRAAFRAATQHFRRSKLETGSFHLLGPNNSRSFAIVRAVNDGVQYDRDAAINKVKEENAEAGAITCIDRMFDGYLRMGMRSREQLLGSAANICGKVLRQFLIETGKQSPESTDAYIRVLTNNELDMVLRDSGN